MLLPSRWRFVNCLSSVDCLFSWVPMQALDTLTPLGRGQALLLTGPPGSGKSSLAVDAVLGQARPCGQPVRCIYAAVGCR